MSVLLMGNKKDKEVNRQVLEEEGRKVSRSKSGQNAKGKSHLRSNDCN